MVVLVSSFASEGVACSVSSQQDLKSRPHRLKTKLVARRCTKVSRDRRDVGRNPRTICLGHNLQPWLIYRNSRNEKT